MQKEISEGEKHISIGMFIVVAGNVLFYVVFFKKKKANRMPILIRFLTKELLVSYPYSVKKYIFFLKKKKYSALMPIFQTKVHFLKHKVLSCHLFFLFFAKNRCYHTHIWSRKRQICQNNKQHYVINDRF